MKRILVIAVVAGAALILGLPAAHLVRSSGAKPVPAIDLRTPETTRQQKEAAGGSTATTKQGSASRPRTSVPGEANPAPALPPAPAGDDAAPAGDDDDDDDDDDDGDDDGGDDD